MFIEVELGKKKNIFHKQVTEPHIFYPKTPGDVKSVNYIFPSIAMSFKNLYQIVIKYLVEFD